MIGIKINKFDEKSEFNELKGIMFDRSSAVRFGSFLADMFGSTEFVLEEVMPDGSGCSTMYRLNEDNEEKDEEV